MKVEYGLTKIVGELIKTLKSETGRRSFRFCFCLERFFDEKRKNILASY